MLTFLIVEDAEHATAVQRVALEPSALEPFYLELGAILDKHREAGD